MVAMTMRPVRAGNNGAQTLAMSGTATLNLDVAKDDQWYYTDGPLRGSLRSTRPLPLYDADPNHLWNRLFAVFYTRPSRLPARPQYPADTTRLDAWDRLLRRGELAPGPTVERIEGGDVLGILAWPKTRYFSRPDRFAHENRLLDEFLESHGERLIDAPLKRAFLQRDLWAVFDHLIGQNIAHFGDRDLARRRAAVADYQIEPDELRTDGRAGIRRRAILCHKLARVIQRLALSRSAIDALPDNCKSWRTILFLRAEINSLASVADNRPSATRSWIVRANGSAGTGASATRTFAINRSSRERIVGYDTE